MLEPSLDTNISEVVETEPIFEPFDDTSAWETPISEQEMSELFNEADSLDIEPLDEQSFETPIDNNSGFDDLQDHYIQEISEVQPIDDLQEWLTDINPNYDPLDYESPYNNNCGSCSLAVWNRLNGYDTEMVASAENIGYNDEMEAITGLQQIEMNPSEIQDYITAQGAGANGIVGIDRADGPGHWFNVYNDGGRVVAIDGQNGSVVDWPPDDLGDVIRWELSVNKI